MLKAIALLKKKDGMTREDFIRYYEDNHSVLVWKTYPWMMKYQRNYVEFAASMAMEHADFDVITEIWFNDRQDYDRLMHVSGNTEAGARISADEENFLDKSATCFFLVEVHETGIGA